MENMDCLTQQEMQELIELLQKLPGIERPEAHRRLLVGLSQDIRNSLLLGKEAKIIIPFMVETVGGVAYFCYDGTYPIVQVIENAQSYIRGGELYQYLGEFLKKLRINHRIERNISKGLPKFEEINSAIFQRALVYFIEEVRTFQQSLPQTIATFNTHVFPWKCQEIQVRMNDLHMRATEFSCKLELVNHPPLAVVAHGLALLDEVTIFITKLASLATLIQKFYENYAYSLAQPTKQRKNISQHFNLLMLCCTTLLERAEELRSKL